MASPNPQDADLRACDMKLLETGNFADTEIVCGDKTFKIHKAVVCTRSVWFEKALTGGFTASPTRQPSHLNETPELIIWSIDQEATTGKVKIEEQNPEVIGVILKYIYGGGEYANVHKSLALLKLCQAAAVNMVEETTNRPVIRFCVDLYRAADFFLLTPMLPIVQRRLGHHCDEKLKWLCTTGVVQAAGDRRAALRWIKDIVDGIKEAYKWNTGPIKKTLMEFVWAGRRRLLGPCWIGIQDDLDKIPAFIKDMLCHCALYPWQKESEWAPPVLSASVLATSKRPRCARCKKLLVPWRTGNSDAFGQVWDPFTMSGGNSVIREWCKECAAMDMIPWRETRT